MVSTSTTFISVIPPGDEYPHAGGLRAALRHRQEVPAANLPGGRTPQEPPRSFETGIRFLKVAIPVLNKGLEIFFILLIKLLNYQKSKNK